MRPARLTKEFWLNAVSRPAMSLGVVTLALLFGLGSTWWSLAETSRIQVAWEAQLLRGIATLRVVEATGLPLPAGRCDRLSEVPGVQASGGLMREEVATPVGATSKRIYLQYVTPGYIAVVFPEESGMSAIGVAAGETLVEQFDLHSGGSFSFTTGSSASTRWVTVDRAVTSETRVPGSGGALLIATPAEGTVTECLVVADPDYVEAVGRTASGWFDGQNVVVSPMLATDDTRANPQLDLTLRTSRFVGLAAGALLLAAAATSWFVRRGELSLYVILGLTRREIMFMTATESLAMFLAPLGMGVAIGTLIGAGNVTPAFLATFPYDMALAVPVLLLTPWVSILILALQSPAATLREA